jgi:hypothetical protein
LTCLWPWREIVCVRKREKVCVLPDTVGKPIFKHIYLIKRKNERVCEREREGKRERVCVCVLCV